MSPIKEFTTAVREVEAPEADLEFTVDGKVLHAFRPGDGQLAILMATTGRHTSTHQQVAGIINFFVEVMDDESANYVTDRLLDRNDTFGLDEVQEVMMWMVEEWSGRPTQSPSVSTPSRRSGGRKSTVRSLPSTSSDSQPTDS